MATNPERTKTLVMPGSRPRPWDDAANDPLLVGLPLEAGHRVLDPYIIYSFVGAGGMGKVFRARHLRLDCDVAIKFLKADWSQRGTDAFQRFAREAKLGARLSSENLVHVTDLGRHGTLQYLVMEWVDGENLHKRVDRLGPRPVDEAVTLLRGIARALAEVHAHGAEHRDVKPGNVILSRRGIVKLADLGLASGLEEDQLAASVEICGTPSFMAPEQWRGLREARSETDVYALGATAVYLLTGQSPGQATPTSVPSLDTTLRGVPADLAAFVRSCMALSSLDRPCDGTAALAALNQLPYGSSDGRLDVSGDAFDGGGLVPLPADEVERVRTSMRAGTTTRRRTGRATLLGLGFATVAVVGASWLLGRGDAEQAPSAGGPSAGKVAGAGERVPVGAAQPPHDDGQAAAPSSEPRDPAAANAPTVGETRPPAPVAPPLVLPKLARLSTVAEATFGAGADAGLPTSLQWLRPVDLGAHVEVQFTVAIEGRHDDVHVTVAAGDGAVRSRTRLDDGRWQVVLDLVPGRHRVQIAPLVLSQAGPAHELDVDVPCTTPELDNLLLESGAADPRVPVVHYRLPHTLQQGTKVPTHALDHVFVPVDRDLLVAVTELTCGQFLEFAQDAVGFARELGADSVYLDLLQKGNTKLARGKLLEWKREGLVGLCRRRPECPVTQILPEEALAFARWLSQRSGVTVRVPTSAEWARVANGNSGRALDSQEHWPLASGEVVANLWVPAKDPVGTEIPGSDRVPELQPVWGRPQGSLFLRHLVGNAAELCVDTVVDGRPQAGTIAGGSYMDSEAVLSGQGQQAWRADKGDTTKLNQTTNGVRLVVGPLSLRRR